MTAGTPLFARAAAAAQRFAPPSAVDTRTLDTAAAGRDGAPRGSRVASGKPTPVRSPYGRKIQQELMQRRKRIEGERRRAAEQRAAARRRLGEEALQQLFEERRQMDDKCEAKGLITKTRESCEDTNQLLEEEECQDGGALERVVPSRRSPVPAARSAQMNRGRAPGMMEPLEGGATHFRRAEAAAEAPPAAAAMAVAPCSEADSVRGVSDDAARSASPQSPGAHSAFSPLPARMEADTSTSSPRRAPVVLTFEKVFLCSTTTVTTFRANPSHSLTCSPYYSPWSRDRPSLSVVHTFEQHEVRCQSFLSAAQSPPFHRYCAACVSPSCLPSVLFAPVRTCRDRSRTTRRNGRAPSKSAASHA